MFGQSPQRIAEGPSHAHAGALGGAADGSQTSAEPDGSPELGDQVVPVALGELESTEVVPPAQTQSSTRRRWSAKDGATGVAARTGVGAETSAPAQRDPAWANGQPPLLAGL